MKPFKLFLRTGIIFFWLIGLGLFLTLPSIGALTQDAKTINVLTFPATLDAKTIADFEKQTGIRVNLVYYESNEELFVKLYSTNGEGYDLFMPSDYTIDKFVKNGLVKPLDKTKLTFWQTIDPRLLGQYFDPENRYTVPYFWAIYGIGVNKTFFNKEVPASWQLLYDYPLQQNKVGMFNVAREALLATAQYLYKETGNLSKEKIDAIQATLVDQKKNVEAYIDADFRSNYLLASNTSPVVVAATPFIAQLMKDTNEIDFIVPHEGSFILIDSWVIFAATKKDDLVYQFINYLFRSSVLLHLFQNYPFFPVTNDLKLLMEENDIPQSIIKAHFDNTIKLEFFKNVLSDESANNVWMTVKTS